MKALICRLRGHRWQQVRGIEPFEVSGDGPHLIGENDCPVGPWMMGCPRLKEYPHHRHVSGYECTRCGRATRHLPR